MARTLTRPAFAYRAGTTILHRAPAWLKLLCVVALSAAAFLSVYGLAASCAALAALSFLGHIPPWNLLRGSKPLVFLSACIVAVKLWAAGAAIAGLCGGAIAVLRIYAPFAAASLLFAVTTMRELRLSLATAETGLKKAFGDRHATAYVSLGLSLMLGFIPRFFYLWELGGTACGARSCKRGLRRLAVLVPLVTERMMEAAADTALALESRGAGAK